MMDGRLKTLHPKIFGGILARAGNEADMAALASQDIKLIDLVIVNLYAFAKAAADSDKPFDQLVDEIDIGGPSLLRAAAKNWRRVYGVISPTQYQELIVSLRHDEPHSARAVEFRHELAMEVFEHTSDYDAHIYPEFARAKFEDGEIRRR